MPKKTEQWSRLDNAAKIFPPTAKGRDTKVFRFACELKEEVDGKLLQQALIKTVDQFPIYRSVLRRGLFWYYLEESSAIPWVHMENTPVCGKIYDKNIKRLLFDVSYFQSRVNLEVFHVLSDGAGAMEFLRALLYHYLTMRHAEEFQDNLPAFDYDASDAQKQDDSFLRYYDKTIKREKAPYRRAYRLHDRRMAEDRMNVILGEASVTQLLAKAHEYQATLTEFLGAVLIRSIYAGMPVRARKKPVTLTVPVNLRKVFPSVSARNFFGIINVPYSFDTHSAELSEIVNVVRDGFERELTEERLAGRMNALGAVEHNPLARIAPLFFKDFVLSVANKISDAETTAALSNVGKVRMPPELAKYINKFDVLFSTQKVQLCTCSFGDKMSFGFTSAFVSAEVQREFFRTLSKMGIEITISACRSEEESK